MTDPQPLDPQQLRWPADRKNLAKSATRALDVLEYFSATRRPLRAIELAHALGYHTSSTDQLLKTMVDSGYLVFDPQRKLYFPSPRLVRFGAWLNGSYCGANHLSNLLQLLHARSSGIVTLAVRQGDAMQVVDLLQPAGPAATLRNGAKVPLIGSALGTALLAGWPDDRVAATVRRVERGHRTLEDRVADVLQGVARARHAGYASGGVAESAGLWSIALGLPRTDAEVDLVLGFAGPADHIRPQEAALAATMRECVAQCLQVPMQASTQTPATA